MAVWASVGNFLFEATGVADKFVAIGMESEGQETMWAEELVATIFANAKRRRAATIVKN